MKSFFGGLFLDKEKLKKEGIYYPIKLEYYKKIEEIDETKENVNNSDIYNIEKNVKYGIEIIKTEYVHDKVWIEKKEIGGITREESVIDEILSILKENEVTPIGAKDVMLEIFTKNLQNVEK